ncbi:MAG: hypothetical protein FWD18_00485 [Micrococcales bacterium]|nr:hypothetical protein [Micrococcales bacterium]
MAQSSFVLGDTEPTRANSGAGTDGHAYPSLVVGDGTGSVTVKAGTVLSDRIIRGWVNIEPGATLRNCVVTGADVATFGRALVNVTVPGTWDGTSQAVIDHCTIQPLASTRRQGYAAGVGNRYYRLTRSLVLDCVDGATVAGTDTAAKVEISGSYISDLMHLVPDPWAARPDTHNDCVQLHGAQNQHDVSDVMLVGSSFDARISPAADPLGPSGSTTRSITAVVLTKPTGPHSSLRVDSCWMRGGEQTLNAADSSITATVSVTGTRWERGKADGGNPEDGIPHVAAFVSRAANLTWTDNTWFSGGAAQPIRVS